MLPDSVRPDGNVKLAFPMGYPVTSRRKRPRPGLPGPEPDAPAPDLGPQPGTTTRIQDGVCSECVRRGSRRRDALVA
jgi:hypothetical protein